MSLDKRANVGGKKPFTRIHRDYLVTVNDNYILSQNGKPTLDLSNDVENVSINYNIDAPPAQCDITIRAPRHKVKGRSKNYKTEYAKAGEPRGVISIKEFSSVKVYAKSRFEYENGEHKYLLVFEGLVVRVVETEESTNHQIVLNCQDFTYWLQMMRINVNPSLITRSLFKDKIYSDPQKAVYGKLTPFQAISYIMKTYTPTDAVLSSPVVKIDERNQTLQDSTEQEAQMMRKWEKFFTENIEKRFQIYGLLASKSESKDSSKTLDKNKKSKQNATDLKKIYVNKISEDIYGAVAKAYEMKMDENLINGFKPYSEIAIPNTFEDEFRSRLESILEITQFLGFEFFQQPNGVIILKPPFYNVYVSEETNPVYVLKEEDIRNAEYSSDAEGVVTQVEARGTSNFQIKNETINDSTFAAYRDPQLALRYGIRSQAIEYRWARTSEQCLAAAIGEVDRVNAKRHQSSMTIEGRPELTLGMPVYIPHRDEFFYIRAMSHNISAGSFTTNLTLDTRRQRYIDEKGQIGRNQITETELPKINGNANYSCILIGGESEIKEDSLVQQIDVSSKGVLSIPLSDEKGYEVVGAFRYGRGYYINEEGKVVAGKSVKNIQFKLNTNTTPINLSTEEINLIQSYPKFLEDAESLDLDNLVIPKTHSGRPNQIKEQLGNTPLDLDDPTVKAVVETQLPQSDLGILNQTIDANVDLDQDGYLGNIPIKSVGSSNTT